MSRQKNIEAGDCRIKRNYQKRRPSSLNRLTSLQSVEKLQLLWYPEPTEMVNELKERADIRGPVLQYNHYLKPEVFNENGGPLKLSEMLLFREFMRRPKRTNSPETQGLVQVGYPGWRKYIRSSALAGKRINAG